MKRVRKAQHKLSTEKLIEGYERLLAEKNQALESARAALQQKHSETHGRDERRFTELEQTLENIRVEIAKPQGGFGLLENIDASAIWLAFFGFVTLVYNDLIKAGLPWLYVCFHLATLFLMVRSAILIYLMFKSKYTLKEIVKTSSSLALISGVSCLVDVWAHGHLNYSMSLPMVIYLSVFGAYNLYSGVMDAIKSMSQRFAPLQRRIQTRLNPNALCGTEIWPVPNVNHPAYGKPELMLPLLETIQREIMADLPSKKKPFYTFVFWFQFWEEKIYVFEFWKVKRKIKSLIKQNERVIAVKNAASAHEPISNVTPNIGH